MDWLHVREPVSAWTHGVWVLLCLPACAWLHLRAGRSLVKQAGLAFFSLGLVLCFAGSWLYHSVPPADVAFCMRLDYIGIFVLILGTTTPVVLVVLRGRWRWSILSVFWLMGAAGITLRALAVPLPDGVSTALYIMMGWTSLLCYIELARRLSHRVLRPVWLGGLLYSAGGVVSSAHWPNPWPGAFGAHEVSHALFMAASLLHYGFMLRVVAPFEESEPTSDAVCSLPAPTPLPAPQEA